MVFSNTSFSTLQLRHRTSSLSSPTPEPTNLFLFLEVMGGVSAFPLIGERSLLLLASPRSLCSPRSTLSSSKSSSSSLGSIKNQKKALWYFFLAVSEATYLSLSWSITWNYISCTLFTTLVYAEHDSKDFPHPLTAVFSQNGLFFKRDWFMGNSLFELCSLVFSFIRIVEQRQIFSVRAAFHLCVFHILNPYIRYLGKTKLINRKDSVFRIF